MLLGFVFLTSCSGNKGSGSKPNQQKVKQEKKLQEEPVELKKDEIDEANGGTSKEDNGQKIVATNGKQEAKDALSEKKDNTLESPTPQPPLKQNQFDVKESLPFPRYGRRVMCMDDSCKQLLLLGDNADEIIDQDGKFIKQLAVRYGSNYEEYADVGLKYYIRSTASNSLDIFDYSGTLVGEVNTRSDISRQGTSISGSWLGSIRKQYEEKDQAIGVWHVDQYKESTKSQSALYYIPVPGKNETNFKKEDVRVGMADGKLAASISDGSIWIWDITKKTNKQHGPFQHPLTPAKKGYSEPKMFNLALSGNMKSGYYMVSLSSESKFLVWDVTDSKNPSVLHTEELACSYVDELAFEKQVRPNGRPMFAFVCGKKFQIWEIRLDEDKTIVKVAEIDLPENRLRHLAIRGDYLMSTGRFANVIQDLHIWNRKTKKGKVISALPFSYSSSEYYGIKGDYVLLQKNIYASSTGQLMTHHDADGISSSFYFDHEYMYRFSSLDQKTRTRSLHAYQLEEGKNKNSIKFTENKNVVLDSVLSIPEKARKHNDDIYFKNKTFVFVTKDKTEDYTVYASVHHVGLKNKKKKLKKPPLLKLKNIEIQDVAILNNGFIFSGCHRKLEGSWHPDYLGMWYWDGNSEHQAKSIFETEKPIRGCFGRVAISEKKNSFISFGRYGNRKMYVVDISNISNAKVTEITNKSYLEHRPKGEVTLMTFWRDFLITGSSDNTLRFWTITKNSATHIQTTKVNSDRFFRDILSTDESDTLRLLGMSHVNPEIIEIKKVGE